MARPVQKPEVGQIVYEAFYPQRPGKIAAIVAIDETFPTVGTVVEVKWVNGTRSQVRNAILQDFQSLIDDHKKKLKNHLSKMKLAEAL